MWTHTLIIINCEVKTCNSYFSGKGHMTVTLQMFRIQAYDIAIYVLKDAMCDFFIAQLCTIICLSQISL